MFPFSLGISTLRTGFGRYFPSKTNFTSSSPLSLRYCRRCSTSIPSTPCAPCESSHGKTRNFHPMYPPHLHPRVRAVYWTSSCIADLSHFGCLIRFVFLGSGLCLKLPSDSISRWTPLLLANGSQLPAPIAIFHRLATRHAWRTIKRSWEIEFPKNVYNINSLFSEIYRSGIPLGNP